MHGFTYSGHPVACAVALANLEIDRARGARAPQARGARALPGGRAAERLAELAEVGDIRSRGLMAGVELVANRETRERFDRRAPAAARPPQEAREHGLVDPPLLDDVLLLAPPFVISEEQIDRSVQALYDSIVATR